MMNEEVAAAFLTSVLPSRLFSKRCGTCFDGLDLVMGDGRLWDGDREEGKRMRIGRAMMLSIVQEVATLRLRRSPPVLPSLCVLHQRTLSGA